MPDRMLLADIARRQHGLVTRQQACDAGFSRGQIETSLPTEAGRPSSEGLPTRKPPAWKTSVLAAVLRTDGVASHRSAGFLWSLDGIRAVASRGDRAPRPKGRVPNRRRASDHPVGPSRGDRRSGIAVTGVARTLLDMAWWLSLTDLLIAVDDAGCGTSSAGRTCTRCIAATADRAAPAAARSGSCSSGTSARRPCHGADGTGWSRAMLMDGGLPKAELEYTVQGPDGFRLTWTSRTRSRASASSSTRPPGTSIAPRSRTTLVAATRCRTSGGRSSTSPGATTPSAATNWSPPSGRHSSQCRPTRI